MAKSSVHWLTPLGGLLASTLPACPVCAAASGGLLSAMGLGVVATSGAARWLIPALLVVGLFGLGLAARRSGELWVVVLGTLGAAIVLWGWWTASRSALVAGSALLIVASIINVNPGGVPQRAARARTEGREKR